MKLNKKITNSYQHKINITKTGLTAIFISARCQSKEQINSNVDEDLRIEINNLKFREIPPEKNIQLFNIPPAFNGSKLKGLKKTVIFMAVLNKGENIIHLIPRNSAFIEEIEVQELSDKQVLDFKLENIAEGPELSRRAEDGNRRPWLTFALVDLPLKSITANVTTKWRFRDSDDIKLIIDNEIQKNKLSLLHKNWLWSGSIFKKLFQNETQTKTVETNLSKGLHYIEFWADRRPILHKIIFNFGKIELRPRAKIIWEYTHLRKNPTTNSEVVFDEINKDEQVIVLEKAIQGERVRNEVNNKLLSTNRWHKVEYMGKTGFMYSLSLEIEGESKKNIQKIITQEAKDIGIDPEILLSLAKCESEFFPYTVSFDEESPEIAFGVMQLSNILLKDLNDKTKQFYSPVNNLFNIKQNIRGGISFFNYLYNVKYKSEKDRLRKSVAAYNAGPSNVKVGEQLDLHLYDPETQRIVSCVQGHLEKKTFKNFLKYILGVGVGLFLIFQFTLFFEALLEPKNEVIIYSDSAIYTTKIKNLDIQFQDNTINNGEKYSMDPECMTSEGYMGEEFCKTYKEWAGWD